MNRKIDYILFSSLKAKDEPAPELNRQILYEWSKEDRTMKRNHFNKGAVAAACMCILATGSMTAYAAYHFLNPVQIAEEVQNTTLSNAFEGAEAIEINETQTSNGYSITLLGLVSGENLDAYVPRDKKAEIDLRKTYAAFAIMRTDGTDLKVNNLCVSPLVNGIKFTDMNNSNMGGSLIWFMQDGVLYELYSCDNLEIFADRGVYLGVVDQFGNETAAFLKDDESGTYSKVEDYTETNALFKLPFDSSLANREVAEQYLDNLEDNEESEVPEEKQFESVDKFLNTLTAENIDDYFNKNKESVLTATPDKKGWIDFGSYYDSELGTTVTGDSGLIEYMIGEDEDMRICGYAISQKSKKSQNVTGMQIVVIFRNGDGSFTSTVYNSKDNIGEFVK